MDCSDWLLQILHGSLLIWAPDKVDILQVRTTMGLTHLVKSLTQICTILHTPRNPQTSVRVLQLG